MRLRFGAVVSAVLLLAFFMAPSLAVHAQSQPSRVITLGGDITEIIYRLGEQGRLAGRDATSKFPAEAQAIPEVGYFRQLGAEGVLSLKPDLILAAASAGPPEVLQQIVATGVPVVRLADAHTTDGLLDKVERIAKALGVVEKGAQLAAKLRQDIAEATSAIAAMPGKPKVLFIMNAGGGAPMAAGRDTAADSLIALCHGENVFAAHTGYKALSSEAMAAAAPEAIGLMEHTLQSMGGVSAVTGHPALRLSPAAKESRIVARDGSFLLSFGPRLPEAMVDFARAIRGKSHS
jgi:iron complex transport system substrate-binding protein